MSTILKALRRLEQDKSAHVQKPLRQEVATETSETRRGLPVILSVGAVFAAGVALGTVALLLWPRPVAEISNAEPAPVAARPSPPPAQVATAPPFVRPAAPAPAAAPELAQHLSAEALSSQVEVVKLPGPEAAEPDIETAQAPPRPPALGEIRPGEVAMRPLPRQPAPEPEPAAPAPLVPAGVAGLPVDGPVEPVAAEPVRMAEADPPLTGTVVARPAPGPTPKAAATPVVPTSAVAKSAVPEITPKVPAAAPPVPAPVEPQPAKPEAVAAAPKPKAAAPKPKPEPVAKAPSPDVSVAKTHWHPLPERRLAIVDVSGHDEPLRLHEGDEVGPLRVAKIEPSAVVFVQDGVEVRHAVGAD